MKPPLFEYHDPATLDEALALLKAHGDEAKVLAGGQSLGPMLNMRLIYPSVLVDINRIEELSGHQSSEEGMRIGALTRQSNLEDDRELSVRQPLIAAALPFIAHRAIRNRGTIGGSLSHADPAAEWGALALALDAELIVRRADAAPRTIAAADFHAGLLATALAPDELLTEIRVPSWTQGRGWSFKEFNRRHGDFAIAGVAAWLDLDENQICRAAAIALIGVGDKPVRARKAEALLAGAAANAELFAAVAGAASQEIEPFDDPHASAVYRRHLTAVLVQDALDQAKLRAGRVH